MAKEMTLADLFHDTLKDIYFAERQILKALPKMARAAQSDKLRQGFLKHKEETMLRIKRETKNRLRTKRPSKLLHQLHNLSNLICYNGFSLSVKLGFFEC